MRKSVFTVWAWTWALCVLVALAGCGSDDADDTGDSDGTFAGEVGESASTLISAADGGTLQTASGSATLIVPAGALADDTELTVETLAVDGMPDVDNLGSYVFEFGPDGTTFAEAATLALTFDGNVPDGKQAVLAVLVDDAWETIAGSALADGKVSGQVEHFSHFVIRFIDGGAEIVSDDEACQQMSFTPCGGDVVGTWEILSLCVSGVIEGMENPWAEMDESCADATFGAETDWEGTLTFNDDGTFSQTSTQMVTFFFEFDEDCLNFLAENSPAVYGETPEAVCQYASEESEMGPCAYADGVCACEKPAMDEPRVLDVTGTYTTEGTMMTVNIDGSDKSATLNYCRDGEYLLNETTSGDDDTITDYMILKKK